MRHPWLSIFMLIPSGCEHIENTVFDYETTQLVLEYSLPADGCDWHFREVGTTNDPARYAPSDDSNKVIQNFVQNTPASHGPFTQGIQVEVTFTSTGKKKEVICGWGTTREMDEIKVKRLSLIGNW